MAAKDIDMVAAALIERTIDEIELFEEGGRNDGAIQKQAALLTRDYLRAGVLDLDAIRYLEHQLREGVICAISTGGDESGACGFVDGLVSCVD